jgi:predicted permease
VLFELFGRSGGAHKGWRELLKGFLQKLAANPLIIGIAVGLLWRAGGLALPSLAQRFVDAIADTAGPLALLAMGLGLRKFGISGNLLPSIVLSALKLMLMPALALAAAWALGLPPLAAKVAVATASMPSGVNSYLIAVQFRTGEALASSQMTIATIAAVVTTAFWLTIAQAVFG